MFSIVLAFVFAPAFSTSSAPSVVPSNQGPGIVSASPKLQFRMQVDSDAAQPVLGPSVVLERASGVFPLDRDQDGMTPFLEMGRKENLEINLLELPTQHGEMVGQRIQWKLSDHALSDTDYYTVRVTQPEARRVAFNSADSISDSFHSLWRLSALPGSQYAFSGSVAYMGNAEAIDAYFRFHGLTNMPMFRQAILIRMDRDEDLGASGAILAIDTVNVGYAATPQVDALYIGPGQPGGLAASLVGYFPPASAASSSPGSIEATVYGPQDRVYLRLSGSLQKGDNLILVSAPVAPLMGSGGRSAGTPGSRTISAALGEMVSGPSGSGVAFMQSSCNCTPAGGVDCSGNADCETSAPAGSYCTTSYSNSTSDEGECFCVPAGVSENYTWSLSVAVGYNVSVTLNLPGNAGSIGTQRNITVTGSYTWGKTYSGGHGGPGTTGHGMCFQNQRCTKKKTQSCYWYETEFFFGLGNDGWFSRKVKKTDTFACEVVTVGTGNCYY